MTSMHMLCVIHGNDVHTLCTVACVCAWLFPSMPLTQYNNDCTHSVLFDYVYSYCTGSEYSGSARSPLKSVDSPTLVTPVTPITQTSTMSPLLTSSSTVTSLTPSTTYTTLSSSLPAESSNDDYALALVPLIGGGIQLPAISQDLFSEYPIHPAPSSLLNSPHPDKWGYTHTHTLMMHTVLLECFASIKHLQTLRWLINSQQ